MNLFKKGKLFLKENFLLISLCIIFTIIGVFLTQNEVSMDDWYIEASADGLFGDGNRSLMVLCGNYILTGLIWLLSQTGYRFFWLHVINVVFGFFSSFLVSKMLVGKFGKKQGLLITGIFLFVSTPVFYYVLNLTMAASYFIACGFAWFMYCTDQYIKKWHYIPGVLCIIIGMSFRWDCLFFSMAFFGLIWLIRVIGKVKSSTKSKEQKHIIFHYAKPFIITFGLLFFILLTQNIVFKHLTGDFNEWNTARTAIDDYQMPSYEEKKAEYQDIGISENDYNVLRSWNNLDPSFFTLEKFEELGEIKKQENLEEYSLKTLLYNILYNLGDNVCFWLIIVLITISLLNKQPVLAIKLGSLLCVDIVLIGYFIKIGRLIWRIEWSIWLALFISVLTLITKEDLENIIWLSTHKIIKTISLIAIIYTLTLYQPFQGNGLYNVMGGKSTVNMYQFCLEKEDIFGKYFINKLFRQETYKAVTTNRYVTENVLNDKDYFYFVLITQNWTQPYPMTEKDIFRTADIGTASNYGTLGQYITQLEPMQNNFVQYGITNSFASLTEDFVRIIVRTSEMYDRTNEINTYLQEHYNKNTSFSILSEVDDVIIGKYLEPIDIDNVQVEQLTTNIEFFDTCQYEGFSKIVINDVNLDFSKFDNQYLQLIDSKGNIQRYSFYSSSDENAIYLYQDVLKDKSNYKFFLILEKSAENYVFQIENQ